jgi:hypothetical protein
VPKNYFFDFLAGAAFFAAGFFAAGFFAGFFAAVFFAAMIATSVRHFMSC